MSVKKISVNELVLYSGEFQELASFILKKIKSNNPKKLIVVHINLRNYYYLNKERNLKKQIKEECLTVLDGIGMKIGLLAGGFGLVKDLNGTDLFPLFINEFIKQKYRIFLLGAKENVIKKVSEKLILEYPAIILSGIHNGYFTDSEEEIIIEKINESKSDILIIGRGFPLQEKFVLKNKNKLKVPFIWNVGGLFDFLSGDKKRAPLFLIRVRLEWLYRFMLEPARMLHRNTVAACWSFFSLTMGGKEIL